MGKVHTSAKHSQNKKPKCKPFLVRLWTLGFYFTIIDKYLVICNLHMEHGMFAFNIR